MNALKQIKNDQPNLNRWLAFICLLVVLGSIIYYIALLHSTTHENQRKSQVFGQSLSASINQFEYLPDLLGKDVLVLKQLIEKTTNHEELSNKLKYITNRSGADHIFLLDAQGTVVASSNFDLGENLSFYGRNYSFRPYFTEAKNLRLRQFYFAKGVTTGIAGFFISSPIMDEYSGEVIGVVVVKLELSHWEEAWRQSTDNIIVADNNGVVILSSDPEWIYSSIGEIPLEAQQEIIQNKQFPNELHEPIYSKSTPLYFIGGGKSIFWKMDNANHLVSAYAMQDTGWTLYHLEKHSRLYKAFLLVLTTLCSLGVICYMLMRERTNKKDMRQKARELEAQRRAQLQLLIDNIHIGVLVFDEEGNILSTNEHANHLLLGNKDINDKQPIKVTELIDIDIKAEDFDNYLLQDISTPAYHETFALNKSRAVEKNTSNKNDRPKIPVMFSVGKVEVESGEGYLMTVIDITSRKVVENELLQLNESLEEKVDQRTKELKDTQSALMQKNKVVALGNMAATIVHELSQPLAAINSSTAAIQAKLEARNWSGLGESAARLKPLSNKMNNVVKLLKYFSYADQHTNEAFDMVELVNETVEVIKDSLNEKGVTISMSLPHNDLMVRGNRVKIDLAISNILKNAIEAAEQNDKPHIAISTEITKDNMLVLYVEDNGEGVGEHIMGQLFNPYFTTKEVGKGMGLGLSITYEIVQQYGGTIGATNTENGAKFSLSLPIVSADSPLSSNDQRKISRNKKRESLINVTGD